MWRRHSIYAACDCWTDAVPTGTISNWDTGQQREDKNGKKKRVPEKHGVIPPAGRAATRRGGWLSGTGRGLFARSYAIPNYWAPALGSAPLTKNVV